MKILYLLGYPMFPIGGAQLSTFTLSSILDREFSVETRILSPKGYREIDSRDYPNLYEIEGPSYAINSVFRSPLNFFHWLKLVEKEVIDFEPDIVHSQMPVTLPIAYLLKKKLNIHAIHTDRGLWELYRSPMKIVNRLCAKKIDHVITTTDHNAVSWKKHTSANVDVVPNTVASYFSGYNESERLYWREKYEIDPTNTVVGFAGRAIGMKNWPMAIEIANSLIDKFHDLSIVVALAVNEQKVEEIAAAKKIASAFESMTCSKKIVFWNLSPFEMPNFYYLIDLMIVPSHYEPFGRTAVEAMSRGCCVLASDVNGLREVIGDPELLCRVNTEAFFEKASICLKTDTIARKKLDMLIRFQERFSPKIVAKKQNDIYRKVIYGT